MLQNGGAAKKSCMAAAQIVARKIGAQQEDCGADGYGKMGRSKEELRRRLLRKWAHSAAMILRGAEMGRTAAQRWHGGCVQNGRTALRWFCAARKWGAPLRNAGVAGVCKMGAQRCDDFARRGNGAHSCATLARRVCAK